MPSLSRTCALYLRLGCVVATLAAAYACDARTPTAPALVPASLRGDKSGDAELGSISLTPAAGFSEFAMIPENTWALVRVTGKWIVKPNPACGDQPPNWPCSSLEPYSGFDPEYPDAFRGPVRLAAVSPTGSVDVLELRGVGGPDEGIGLTQREFSRTVLATPALINPTVQEFGTTGPSIASYIFDGSYTVTVTAITSPIRVTEGAAETDGSRSYTVEPLYGLQLINPHSSSSEPPGAARWFFVPGEDIDPAAPNSDPPWAINECRNQTSCRWTPPGPGRVQVSAFVEARRARARSVGAPQCASASDCSQEPKLVLRCDGRTDTDSVLRGNHMECVATAEPAAATLTALQWRFNDEQGHTIPGPAGELKWAGIMVVGGQVQITGTVNGKPSGATLAVTVTARDWRNKITFPPEPQPTWTKEAPLVYPPTLEGDTLTDGTLGKARYPYPEPASGYGRGTGPNEGWYFLDQLPYFSPTGSRIYLNLALDPSDPFYQAQQGPSSAFGRVVLGQLPCGQEFMRRAARHVPAHESGHYSRGKAFAESAEGSSLLESALVFGMDPADDSTAYSTMFQRFFAADSAIQADWDKRNVLRVPCRFTVPAH
jgi:hypothetical protein